MSDKRFNELMKRGEKYKGLDALAKNEAVIASLNKAIDAHRDNALDLKTDSDNSRFKSLVAMNVYIDIKRQIESAGRLDKINDVNVEKHQNPSKESI